MAQIIIKGVSFVIAPSTPQIVTIKYRLTGDPDVTSSYIVVGTDITVAPDGTITPNITLSNLLNNTSYTIMVSNNCSGRSKSITVITENPTTYVWVEDVFVCEQGTLITEVVHGVNFSSPNKLFYNEAQNRVYCVDSDSPNGNIFWFNPNTFVGESSVTYVDVASIKGKQIYDNCIAFDKTRNKIYMAGETSGGLIIYDMATGLVTTPDDNINLRYGNNNAFDRLLVRQLDDYIYCSHTVGTDLAVYNANTLTKVSNASSIPQRGLAFSGSYDIYDVNGERWVCPASGRARGEIFIYNRQLSSLLGVGGAPTESVADATIYISDPQATLHSKVAFGGGYWGSGFFDKEKNKFYYHDIGSSVTFIIDVFTRAIVKKIEWTNRQLKSVAQIDFSFDPTTGRLYFNYSGFTSLGDSASTVQRRTYIFNRDNLYVDSVFPGIITSGLVPQIGSKYLWSANRGLAAWNGGSEWRTDGIISKLSY